MTSKSPVNNTITWNLTSSLGVPVFFVVLVIYLLGFCSLAPSAYAQDEFETPAITVAYSVDSFPYQFKDRQGNPAGMIIDFWKIWSARSGVDVVFIPADWKGTLKLLRRGYVDAHAGLFYSEQRDEFADYGQSLASSDSHIFYRNTLPSLSDKQTLLPYRVGVIGGDFIESRLKLDVPDLTLVPYKNYDDLMSALKIGQLNVFVADTPTALFFLKQYNLSLDFNHNLSSPLYTNNWRIAVPQGKEHTLQLFREGMDKITPRELLPVIRKWTAGGDIKDSNSLIFAIDRDYPPFYFLGPTGSPKGLLVDVWKKWGEYTNTPVEFRASNWTETIEAVDNRVVDVHGGIFESPGRLDIYDFSLPVYPVKSALFFPENKEMLTLEELAGSRVGVIRGSYQRNYLNKYWPDIIATPFVDSKQLVQGALDGTVVAIFNEIANIDQELFRIGHQGALVQSHELSLSNNFYAAVPKGNKELLQKINEGLRNFDQKYLARLERKWIRSSSLRQFDEDSPSTIVNLNEAEKKYLNENPVLRVAATPDWPPFEFRENGEHKGVAAELLALAAKRLGVGLDVHFNEWSLVLDKLKNKKLDVGPAMVATEQRADYLNFTTPVFVSQVAIWVRNGTDDIHDIHDLKGKVVSVENGYATHEILKTLYPDIALHLTTSPIDAIRATSSGKADAYIGNLSATTYLLNKNVITNLSVAGFFDEASRDLRMGVRNDAPHLLSALNKAIGTITAQEKSQLLAKYVPEISQSSSAGVEFLTPSDKVWLKQHADLRVGANLFRPPFEYYEGIVFNGVSSILLERLGRDIGVDFPTILPFSGMEGRALLQDKQVDMLPCVERIGGDENVLYSKPYGAYPYVIFQRLDSVGVKGLDELSGKLVGVVQGQGIKDILAADYSDINTIDYSALHDAFRALNTGDLDAVICNLAAGEAIKRESSFYNISAQAETPYVQELHFGVRSDWPELVKIINSWLGANDFESITSLEQLVGISSVTISPVSVKESLGVAQIFYFGIGLIVIFILAAIAFFVLRRFVTTRAEDLYNSYQFKVVAIVVLLLSLCLIVVMAWGLISRMETYARQRIGDAMESVLLTTHEALVSWSEQNKYYVSELATSPTIVEYTKQLMEAGDKPKSYLYRNARRELRQEISGAMVSGATDYAIISKDYLNIVTSSNKRLMEKSSISIQRPRRMDAVLAGKTVFVPPFKRSGGTDAEAEEVPVELAFASPIKDANGDILAILVVYYNTKDDFQRMISLARIGQTGETYVFDRHGNLASESRFDDMLRELNLIGDGQHALLSLRLSDPGGNLLEGHVMDTEIVPPLTEMARSALSGKSGNSIDGYRDYRGVPVLGAWLWENDLQIGIAVEIDQEEGLGSYVQVRTMVISILSLTILLGSLLMGLSNWIGRSATKSLRKAKDELEDRVEERTAELKKLTQAVEQSPSSVVITDTKGTIEYVNPRFTEVTGYTAEEAIGQNPRILKAGNEDPSFYKDMWDTILSGEIWAGDLINKKKDGTIFWERASIAPILNSEGVLAHFVAVKEDITQRKAEEERFQALLDAAPDAMVIVNRDGSIALVNIATEDLFGYSREFLVGQKVEVLLPDYIRDKHPAYRDKFFDTADLSIVANKNFYGQNKDGLQIPVDISLSPIETPEGLQVIASIRDITERKKAEQALAESEELTRLILTSAGEGIFGVNLKGRVVFINEAACQMLGYERQEIMGVEVHGLIHHTRPDGSYYPVEECPMRDAFVLGASSRVDNEVLWRKDNSSFYVEYSAVPVMRGEEKVGAVISFQDISARRLAEEALVQAKVETEDALALVTSSIQYASRIQRSVLPPDGLIESFTTDHFVVWEPRDVVGGDMYWCYKWGTGCLVVLGDCTGHGVPGAFVSLIATGALERALQEVEAGDVATLTQKMHQHMQKMLGQDNGDIGDTSSDDGLELGMCFIPEDRSSITFSGARMQLFIDDGEVVHKVKPDKKGIAYRGIPFDFTYTNHIVEVNEGIRFFMTTDGLIDQIGGTKRRGFGKKRFVALLEALRNTPLHEQGDMIYDALITYEEKETRRDDVSLIGFSI
ncbi:MAG: transporter substrate-binding domain-containing protein [Desulfovibrio sp.]